ncbi:hypothetical protein SG0102_21610 [Intestinibaculum porci]|uniref:Transporter n=1 Tax=Intestinibaculum porci TaxID=2487118 RepID=A0A3G9J7Q4_9FIRM|nr:phosphate-starvation-inducible PsiE family protein [Intestinibaculum porci]BBH27227.1 hypothetical protein SG0102_21610 [Intestinibaculum porci]
MKKCNSIDKVLIRLTFYMEFFISTILAVTVFIAAIYLILDIPHLINNKLLTSGVHEILSYCFNLIILVEFIRMLVKHSMENVIEVLIFAIARGLIVDHANTVSLAISILALAVLFAVRKYLLLPDDFISDEEKYEHQQ